MDRRRSENRRPQSRPQSNSVNANVERGFTQEARVVQVEEHARRLQKFSCLDAETARRIAEKQAGQRDQGPRHGRRVQPSGAQSASMRASHGSLWERNGIRPPNSDNVEVDKGRTRTIHQKYSVSERELVRNRGKRRHCIGTAQRASASPMQGSGAEDVVIEEAEGKHPVKPHLAILSLVEMEADDEVHESEAGTERSEVSQAESSSPRNHHLVHKTISREEERKLVEHAFLKAREHKAAARVALNKVPAEALSGESHFDLAAFMRSTAER